MNEIATIDTNNYAAMAKMMGIQAETEAPKKTNTLNRLRLWHQPVMGQTEIKGRMTNVEVIEGGTYRLEVINGDRSEFFYSKTAKVRPFVQRFMLRRYISFPNAKPGEPKGKFDRTIMAETLNIDLKDNTGKVNCGKPSGYIKDFKALPANMQDLIRQIKRVRVLFGIVTLEKAMNADGEMVGDITHPFIWEIDNKEAFNTVGEPFKTFAKQERIPLQYQISFEEPKKNDLPNGSSYYTPICSPDMSVTHEITDEDHETFGGFLEWIKNYNDYIYKEWDAKQEQIRESLSTEDEELVEDFIDVEVDDEVA
jgi:hypothetical protein